MCAGAQVQAAPAWAARQQSSLGQALMPATLTSRFNRIKSPESAQVVKLSALVQAYPIAHVAPPDTVVQQ